MLTEEFVGEEELGHTSPMVERRTLYHLHLLSSPPLPAMHLGGRTVASTAVKAPNFVSMHGSFGTIHESPGSSDGLSLSSSSYAHNGVPRRFISALSGDSFLVVRLP
jgi:hypothetical protein